MSQRDAHDGFKLAAKLVAAIDRCQAEIERRKRELAARTPAARAEFARALGRARREGATFGQLAGATFAAVHGRVPTPDERRREAARLRQLHRRYSVTTRGLCHGDRQRPGGLGVRDPLRSNAGGIESMHDDQFPHPVRRTVIEEYGPLGPVPAPPLGAPLIDDPRVQPLGYPNGCDLPPLGDDD